MKSFQLEITAEKPSAFADSAGWRARFVQFWGSFSSREVKISPVEETFTPFEETFTSLEEISTPFEEIFTSREETSAPLEEILTSREEIFTSTQVKITP